MSARVHQRPLPDKRKSLGVYYLHTLAERRQCGFRVTSIVKIVGAATTADRLTVLHGRENGRRSAKSSCVNGAEQGWPQCYAVKLSERTNSTGGRNHVRGHRPVRRLRFIRKFFTRTTRMPFFLFDNKVKPVCTHLSLNPRLFVAHDMANKSNTINTVTNHPEHRLDIETEYEPLLPRYNRLYKECTFYQLKYFSTKRPLPLQLRKQPKTTSLSKTQHQM